MEAGGTGGVVCLLLIYFFKSPLRHLILGYRNKVNPPGPWTLFCVFIFYFPCVQCVDANIWASCVFWGELQNDLDFFFFFILSSLLNALSPFDIFLCH